MAFRLIFPAPEVPVGLLSWMLAHPKFYGVVAEIDGRLAGSNFLDERNAIAGVGPITVDPAVQNRAIGRRLMDAVHERAASKNFAGVRLIQSGFHTRSLSLYAKLGYDVREHLACMQGNALKLSIEGYIVRPAAEADIRPAAGCSASPRTRPRRRVARCHCERLGNSGGARRAY